MYYAECSSVYSGAPRFEWKLFAIGEYYGADVVAGALYGAVELRLATSGLAKMG